ncbi:MAG: cysteine synthase A [Hyphomicrobium sp.]
MTEGFPIKTLKTTKTWGRGRIYDDITQTIGHTPLVRLSKIAREAGTRADILMKLEFFNPLSSVKDRIGVSMIDVLESEGKITPGKSVLVEPTSGNTGIGLAFVAASRGYKLILVMPESMSIERRKILAHLGAELELTPAANGMPGAISRANEILTNTPHAVQPSQFENPANPAVHEQTTAEEIWNDTKGNLDVLVIGVGTGGTLTGCGRALKARKPTLKVIAVEPTGSPILSGGNRGPHKIQGIGAGFVPKVLDKSLIDEVITISNDQAFETSRHLSKTEGIPGGISTGANLAAAISVASRENMTGKTVVTFAPSCAERYYTSELFLEQGPPKP